MTAATMQPQLLPARQLVVVDAGVHHSNRGYPLVVHNPKGKLWRDHNIIKLPVVGGLIHKMNIEIFFRVFSIVYSGSGNNIEVLQIAAEACGNAHMERQVKEITIPRMLKEGAGLIDAIEASEVFTDTAITTSERRFRHRFVKTQPSRSRPTTKKKQNTKFQSILQTIDVMTALFILVVMTALIVFPRKVRFMRPPAPGM